MINLTKYQTIYISVCVVCFVLLLAISAFFIYKRVWSKKHYREATYIELAHFAKVNDYLLLNNFAIDFDESHVGVVDHILISKKYIFVINDFDLSGLVSGEVRGQYLRVIDKHEKASKVVNPLNYNINLIKRINVYNHLDQSFVKGIVNINNDSEISPGLQGEQFMMIRRKELCKKILEFDKEKIGNLKENDVVSFINKLSKKNDK